jgi:hypothetical protein
MTHNTFEGTSNRGDFQEALTNAVDNALNSASGADMLIAWELEKVTGERGGIAGVDNITVTIQTRTDSKK